MHLNDYLCISLEHTIGSNNHLASHCCTLAAPHKKKKGTHLRDVIRSRGDGPKNFHKWDWSHAYEAIDHEFLIGKAMPAECQRQQAQRAPHLSNVIEHLLLS